MNAPVLPKDVKGSPETVTTGPVTGSRKAYASPAGRPDIRVPYREIVLSDPKEEPVRVYDPSGPTPRPTRGSTSMPASPACASPGSRPAATRPSRRGR